MATLRADDSKRNPQEIFWMDKLKKAMEDKTNSSLAVFETCLALMKTTTEQVAKVKHEFKQFATKSLLDSSIEENLKDYRECIIPRNQNATFSEYMSNSLEYCYQRAVVWTGWHHYAMTHIIKSGCTYKPEMKKIVNEVHVLSLIIVLVIRETMKFMKYTPLPPVTEVKFPDYIAKNTGNTILFFRDFMIIRDFHDLLKRMTMMFVCRQRHFIMQNLHLGYS